jgi:Cd2+/Zn2+-exporting ATPase
VGRILISDQVKEGAAEAVAKLRRMGLATVMLTGDGEESANAVAEQVGVDAVRARLLPQEKLSALEELRQQYGPVLFTGDGINDAPVLSGADVGAAMGSGADAAIEAADVVFLTSDPEAVPRAVELARQVNGVARQNVVFALAVKALVLVLGMCHLANLWLAVFADTGVAMLCIINSIRILSLRRPEGTL